MPSGTAENPPVLWIAGGLLVWIVLAVLAGVVLGRGIRLADRRDARASALSTADLPAGFASAA
jgi:hypothetical protein